MLKFFRLYNKYILAIGMALLMIAFLLQPVMSMFTPSGGSRIIGRINGEKIRHRDLTQAAAELQALTRLSPIFTLPYEQDPMVWLLAVHEAERLGLSAGPIQVNTLLEAMGADEAMLIRAATSVGANTDFVRQAVRHWIMVETYRSLTLGETRMHPDQRLNNVYALVQSIGPQAFPPMANYLGRPRLSPPLLRRFIVDQNSTVAGDLVLIPAEMAVDPLPQPTDEQVAAMFEQYKDNLPGESEPYGFGYRIPPRVKIDYLTIPFDQVLASVEVDEVEAIAFHEQNPRMFADEQGNPQEYAAVRSRVIDELRQRTAQDRIDQMIRRARAILLEAPAYRQLASDNGYKTIPPDYTPLSLRVVADEIEQQFGIHPQVRYERDRWLSLPDLVALSGIGNSALAERQDVPFWAYILAAREMQPPDDNPLANLHLQTNVVSQPMRSEDGSLHLFRLVAAEPAHAPPGLDAVREQVAADAARLAAFEQLTADADAWAGRTAEQGLNELADQLSLTVIDLDQITRAGMDERSAPNLPVIGRDPDFVHTVYERADQLNSRDAPIDQQPPADRIVTSPIEAQLALAIFRIDRFRPITEAEYRRLSRSRDWQGGAGFALLMTRQLPDPLDFDTLAERSGFVSEWRNNRDEDEGQSRGEGEDQGEQPPADDQP